MDSEEESILPGEGNGQPGLLTEANLRAAAAASLLSPGSSAPAASAAAASAAAGLGLSARMPLLLPAPAPAGAVPAPAVPRGIDHPTIKPIYTMAKAAFQAAGVPASGNLSWSEFHQPFAAAPYPASQEEASALAARLSSDMATFLTSFQTMNKFASKSREPQNKKQRLAIAPAEAPSPSASPDGGGVVVRSRAESPAPSLASICTAVSTGLKRKQLEANLEDAAARAASSAKGEFLIEDSWPREVKCFFPELGAAVLATNRLCMGVGAALSTAFACHGEDPLRMDGESFDMLVPVVDTSNFVSAAESPSRLLDHLREVYVKLARLQEAAVAARAQLKRCFDLYKLATQTRGANWLTVQQLQYREYSDRSNSTFDSTCKPLVAFEDKVRAALIACEQSHTLTKEGAILGPVCPAVAAALRLGPAASAQHGGAPRGKGPRSFTKGAGKASKGGANKPSRKQRKAKKAAAGAGAPVAAAAGGAPAGP
jgi:hypothetical protein